MEETLPNSDYTAALGRLRDAVESLGYPSELVGVLAKQLRGPWSTDRMAGYLRQAKPQSMEQIADELVAICEERDAFVRRKQAEQSNAAVTRLLNEGMPE